MMTRTSLRVGVLVAFFCVGLSVFAASQARSQGHVIFIPMANMSRPSDVDFEGGACDIDREGETMKCAFQQVLISPVKDDPTACMITMNRYEQSQSWVSRAVAEGRAGRACRPSKRSNQGLVVIAFEVSLRQTSFESVG